MRRIPLDIGVLHFIGIGGVGMSGVAEVLHNFGYRIQGSDLAETPNVRRLKNLGVRVFDRQAAENVSDAAIVIVSTAIKPDNPELAEARARLIPVVHRAEMLGELMRLHWAIACAGTHGKTTTTSLVAAMLDVGGLDPTVINGGIINSYGANARTGAGEWMVVEADESDGSFNRLPATVAVVTNIDPEHLDHHGTFDALKEAFRAFVANIPFYGFAVMCGDHPVVRELIPKIPDRRIITYGLTEGVDLRARDLHVTGTGSRFTVEISSRLAGTGVTIADLDLPMYGEHNVLNALAAITIGYEMGFEEVTLRRALAGFQGVKRRFTKTGEAYGVSVIDDYGHHPVEIAAVLKAARAAYPDGRTIAVVQPHRYSRLEQLFDEFCGCFTDADAVIVADVYAAGEEPIAGADRDALVAGLQARGQSTALALMDEVELAAKIADIAQPGDCVVCLGAGSITNWAQSLPDELRHIFATTPLLQSDPGAGNAGAGADDTDTDTGAGATVIAGPGHPSSRGGRQ